MGQIIKATCSICKYKNQFSFGGGRFGHGANLLPALNLKTGQFEHINYVTHKHDANYVFYSDSLLKCFTQEQTTLQSHNFKINRSNNYCPSCKDFTLDFTRVGFFD
jgi:hypothetical protein